MNCKLYCKLVLISIVNLVSCSPAEQPAPTPTPEPEPRVEIQPTLEYIGKRIYQRNCIACHNVNPTKAAHGPDLWGSSLELITLRVRELKYPPGYKPKRSTQGMRKFPNLTDEDIKALWHYLNQPLENY